MHLNIEQILEPDDADIKHLSACEKCRLRSENLGLIRSRLQSIPEKTTTLDQWQDIQSSYCAQAGTTDLIAARKSRKFWQVASGAIAASFVLFMLWQNFSRTPDVVMSPESVIFAALIKENNAMQQHLNEQLTTHPVPNTKTAGLLVELEVVNIEIQQAYLEKKSDEQKMRLWQQRQKLLQSTLSALKQPPVIKV